jgi:hypothetical protein
VDLATAFQKYAQNENGQLVLQFSGTEHLCKISIEDGEAVDIRLGRFDVDETIEFVSSHEIIEVSFIKGFVPKKKLPVPITDRLLGEGAYKSPEKKPSVAKSDIAKPSSGGEQVAAAKINKVISGYVDIVGPLGVVMLENLLKKIDYTRNSPMPADDYTFMVEKLAADVPENMRVEFMQTIK